MQTLLTHLLAGFGLAWLSLHGPAGAFETVFLIGAAWTVFGLART